MLFFSNSKYLHLRKMNCTAIKFIDNVVQVLDYRYVEGFFTKHNIFLEGHTHFHFAAFLKRHNSNSAPCTSRSRRSHATNNTSQLARSSLPIEDLSNEPTADSTAAGCAIVTLFFVVAITSTMNDVPFDESSEDFLKMIRG